MVPWRKAGGTPARRSGRGFGRCWQSQMGGTELAPGFITTRLEITMVHKQSGFTLIEIAIVLVIIGLLLGGILKGQRIRS